LSGSLPPSVNFVGYPVIPIPQNKSNIYFGERTRKKWGGEGKR